MILLQPIYEVSLQTATTSFGVYTHMHVYIMDTVKATGLILKLSTVCMDVEEHCTHKYKLVSIFAVPMKMSYTAILLWQYGVVL